MHRLFHRTYPHSPQVCPQDSCEKVLKNQGFFKCAEKTPQFYTKLWSNFGLQKKSSKLHFCREDMVHFFVLRFLPKGIHQQFFFVV